MSVFTLSIYLRFRFQCDRFKRRSFNTCCSSVIRFILFRQRVLVASILVCIQPIIDFFFYFLIDASPIKCGFENGTLCGWTNDPNNWFATWNIAPDSTLCLNQYRPVSTGQKELSASIYSPFLSGGSRVKCVKFSYSFSSRVQKYQPSKLSLLQKQMG